MVAVAATTSRCRRRHRFDSHGTSQTTQHSGRSSFKSYIFNSAINAELSSSALRVSPTRRVSLVALAVSDTKKEEWLLRKIPDPRILYLLLLLRTKFQIPGRRVFLPGHWQIAGELWLLSWLLAQALQLAREF